MRGRIQLYTGAQINFGDLTPYLTVDYKISYDEDVRAATFARESEPLLKTKITSILEIPDKMFRDTLIWR